MKSPTITKPRKATTAISATSTRANVAKHTLGLLKWPLFGALLAGGALVVARAFGPRVVRDLGDAGGEGFAEGVARVQQQIAELRQRMPSISGERGTYAGAPHPGAFRRERREFADHLAQFAGFAGAGVTIRDPAEPGFRTVYEVRWLRGYPIPMLPPMVKEFPVKLEIVDSLPVARGEYT